MAPTPRGVGSEEPYGIGAGASSRALAPLRRKMTNFLRRRPLQHKKVPPAAAGGLWRQLDRAEQARQGPDGFARFAMALPMLIKLSAMTPRPTQRFMPSVPL